MRHKHAIRSRIRITDDDGVIAIGPGKADLLDAIRRTGSIRAAAADRGMSYMRAWSLIRTMNSGFRSPLVEKVRGGANHGGARLTKRGETVLELYRRMSKEAEKAVSKTWKELQKHF
jgi:molybdate transport system regulatory protein